MLACLQHVSTTTDDSRGFERTQGDESNAVTSKDSTPSRQKSRAITNLEIALNRVRVPSTPPTFAHLASGVRYGWQAKRRLSVLVLPRLPDPFSVHFSASSWVVLSSAENEPLPILRRGNSGCGECLQALRA